MKLSFIWEYEPSGLQESHIECYVDLKSQKTNTISKVKYSNRDAEEEWGFVIRQWSL